MKLQFNYCIPMFKWHVKNVHNGIFTWKWIGMKYIPVCFQKVRKCEKNTICPYINTHNDSRPILIDINE